MKKAIKIFLNLWVDIFLSQKLTESFVFFSLKNIKTKSNIYQCHILITDNFQAIYLGLVQVLMQETCLSFGLLVCYCDRRRA